MKYVVKCVLHSAFLSFAALAGSPSFASTLTPPLASIPAAQVTPIRYHHGHSPWAGGHKYHGDDSYYDDDRDSGVLIKNLLIHGFGWNENEAAEDDGYACLPNKERRQTGASTARRHSFYCQ